MAIFCESSVGTNEESMEMMVEHWTKDVGSHDWEMMATTWLVPLLMFLLFLLEAAGEEKLPSSG